MGMFVAKKQLVKDQDKIIIRLPDGMRDRIKAKAERAGMSMNEAVVWVLEKEFPAPIAIDERLEDLAALVSMLKDSKDIYMGVEHLIEEIEDVLAKVTSHVIPTEPSFRQMVNDRLTYWHELGLARYQETHESPFNDAPAAFSPGSVHLDDDFETPRKDGKN